MNDAQRAAEWLVLAQNGERINARCRANGWYCSLIVVADMQCWVVRSDDALWVIMPGSKFELGDWVANVNITLTNHHVSGRVHAGYYKLALAIDHKLRNTMQTAGLADRLIFCGHSLGAAVAAISAAAVENVEQVYLFGSPRFADSGFTAIYPHRVARFSILGDPVTCIPSLARGWRHLGDCILLDGSREFKSVWWWWEQLINLKNLFDTFRQNRKITAIVNGALQNHKMEQYAGYLRRTNR